MCAGRACRRAGELVEQQLPAAPRPRRLAGPSAALTVLGAVLLIVLPFGYRQAFMLSLIGMAVCLSLVVITGFVGQVSLAQVTLAGVCGFAVAHLIVDAGVGFPWGPIIGSLAAVAVGMAVGASALRVRGVSPRGGHALRSRRDRAVRLRQREVGSRERRFPGRAAEVVRHRPRLRTRRSGGWTASFPARCSASCSSSPSWACVSSSPTCAGARSASRCWRFASNERAAAAAGISVTRVKFTAYAISSFIAGTAGWMYAYNFGSVSAARFGFLIALGFVAYAYIGGITMVSGAIIGGLVATEGLVPYFFEELLGISGNWSLLFGGLLLIVTLIQNPDGVAGTIYRKQQLKRRAALAASASRADRAACRRRHRQWWRSHDVGALCARHLRLVRWSEGRHRRQPRRRAWAAGRPDRPERRREDDIHRRGHRLRAASRRSEHRWSRRHPLSPARTSPARPRPHVAGDRAVRRSHRAGEPHGRRTSPDAARDDQGGAVPGR